MSDIPNNPATALERIFWRVRGSGQSTVKNVWVQVLNARPDTPEFAVRHAEVVYLVRRLQLYLLALPTDDATRVRNEGDIPLWYGAVVHTGNWNADMGANENLISEDKVKLLGSLGENLTLRANFELKGDVPDVDKLRASLDDWTAMLDEVDLPPDLAAKIRQQVEQIEFLLSEVDTYGYEPLAEHSRTLFGLGFGVIKVAGVVGKVGTAMAGLFQFITQVSMHDYGTAANTFAGLLTSASEVFTLASAEQQQAIEAKKQKALTQKPQPDPDDVEVTPNEVVDAEVVDDNPPESPTPDEGEQG